MILTQLLNDEILKCGSHHSECNWFLVTTHKWMRKKKKKKGIVVHYSVVIRTPFSFWPDNSYVLTRIGLATQDKIKAYPIHHSPSRRFFTFFCFLLFFFCNIIILYLFIFWEMLKKDHVYKG